MDGVLATRRENLGTVTALEATQILLVGSDMPLVMESRGQLSRTLRAGDHHFGPTLFHALFGCQSGWVTTAMGLPPMGLQDIVPTENLVALIAAILLPLK